MQISEDSATLMNVEQFRVTIFTELEIAKRWAFLCFRRPAEASQVNSNTPKLITPASLGFGIVYTCRISKGFQCEDMRVLCTAWNLMARSMIKTLKYDILLYLYECGHIIHIQTLFKLPIRLPRIFSYYKRVWLV